MVCGGVLPSIVTCLAKFLTSAHHTPVALPQVTTMDISKHFQVSPRDKTMMETYHSSAVDQQRKKEEVGSICFADIIFPEFDLGPVASTHGILGSVVHFVVKRSRWPCLGSTQPCLCSTISLGYWVIRRGGSWALSRYNGSSLGMLCHCIPMQEQGSQKAGKKMLSLRSQNQVPCLHVPTLRRYSAGCLYPAPSPSFILSQLTS